MERWFTLPYFHFAWTLYELHTFHLQKSSKTELNFERKWQKKVSWTWQYTSYWTKSSQSILPMTIAYESNSYLFYAPNLFNPPGIDG
jgi:hypothetical protein